MRVHPTLLPREHPLAAVRGAFNAVFIEAENAGELMFYGQGAGGTPTASAVLGDLVSAARRLVLGGPQRTETTTGHVPALPIEAATTSYYIGLDVADQPGVLARIAQLFAEHGVSIEIMRQTIHRTPNPTWNRPNCGSSRTAHQRLPSQPPSRPSRAWTSSIQLHPFCG